MAESIMKKKKAGITAGEDFIKILQAVSYVRFYCKDCSISKSGYLNGSCGHLPGWQVFHVPNALIPSAYP